MCRHLRRHCAATYAATCAATHAAYLLAVVVSVPSTSWRRSMRPLRVSCIHGRTAQAGGRRGHPIARPQHGRAVFLMRCATDSLAVSSDVAHSDVCLARCMLCTPHSTQQLPPTLATLARDPCRPSEPDSGSGAHPPQHDAGACRRWAGSDGHLCCPDAEEREGFSPAAQVCVERYPGG